VEVRAAASVRWSDDNWKTVHDTMTRDTGFGYHIASLSAGRRADGSRIEFTFNWIDAERWEGENFVVEVAQTG
jgi:glucoamylase